VDCIRDGREKCRETLKILLAEDDPVHQRVLQCWLVAAGCDVHTADNGREALTYLESNSCDLVLMDVQMPEMDGIKTTIEIRKRWPKSPRIVFVTGCACCRESCFAAGGDDFLVKPVKRQELKAAIFRNTINGAATGDVVR
jgi:CheY-like chemotaxis protein